MRRRLPCLLMRASWRRAPTAQCLRAKDESGWKHFAQALAGHSALGMAMTLRGILATRPSLWHMEDALHRMDVPTLLLTGDEDTPCLEPNLFLKRTLPDAALCVPPRTAISSTSRSPACSIRSCLHS